MNDYSGLRCFIVEGFIALSSGVALVVKSSSGVASSHDPRDIDLAFFVIKLVALINETLRRASYPDKNLVFEIDQRALSLLVAVAIFLLSSHNLRRTGKTSTCPILA
jgi:hypothetical protein